MTNKHTSLNNCGKCDIKKADCQTCKLAALNLDKNAKRKVRIDDDDDPSISERLTDKKEDHSILILFIVAIATFVAVIGFTMLFR